MPHRVPTILLALFAAMPAHAQLATAPVLGTPPNVQYPPIAKAAHVSGDVMVAFAINPDGTTSSVQAISGPAMLLSAVADRIKHWTFKTPLPLNAQTYFEAKYAFSIKTHEDEEEDSLDVPPWMPSSGDVIVILPAATVITGDVHSLDGSQVIDVAATAHTRAADRCPQDPHKTPPARIDFNDYVELFRYNCDEVCPSYRVRVYRNGRVTWRGFNDVAVKGDREALIHSSAADALVTSFGDAQFWSACSVPDPLDPKPKPKPSPSGKQVGEDTDESSNIPTEEVSTGVFLTAGIGGVIKTINAWQYSFSDSDIGQTYAWAIDRSADTHRWRHVDAAAEPYSNMYEDLSSPKSGITLLIRATYHFNPYTAQQTFTYLDKLLKRGEPVDTADTSGWTPLMYASYLDYYLLDDASPNPVKLLLDARADPNRASLHGDTALMFAAYRGKLLQPLLAHGANINAHNADGITALMLLVQSGGDKTDEIKDALAAGADASAKDNLGRTALDYLVAASCGKPILSLPVSAGGMVATIIRQGPQPCPDTTDAAFIASQALLQKGFIYFVPF